MNTKEAEVIVEEPYIVSAVTREQILHKGSGVLKKIGCTWVAERRCVTATSAQAARSKVERSLTKEMDDDAAGEFIDKLEFSIEKVNFQS